MILTFLAAAVACAVTALGAFLSARLGSGTRHWSGTALWLALVLGLVMLRLTGVATTLAVILLGGALAAAAVEAVLTRFGVHRWLRFVAVGLILSAVLVYEWRRGDLFAGGALSAAVVGTACFAAVTFATRAAQRSDLPRTPPGLTLLGLGWLLVVALGLPNPGLLSVLIVGAAAVVPLLALPARGVDPALGASLAALAVATGTYAWIANASPAMVLAPALVIGIDVVYTLVRRVVTAPGRAALTRAGGWWRRLDAWAAPGEDLVAQRAHAAGSSMGWLFGATTVVLVTAAVTWRWDVRWPDAALIALLVAWGWLILLEGRAGLPRAQVVSWLGGLSIAALAIAAALRLTDGRLGVMALPLIVMLAIWVSAVPLGGRAQAPLNVAR